MYLLQQRNSAIYLTSLGGVNYGVGDMASVPL
jgi:hypothetical protein